LFDKKEHFFIVVIVSLIIIAGSGLLVWQTISQKEFVTAGLQDNSDSLKAEQDRLKESDNQNQKEKIYVHITGAVKNNGVYKFEKGARVVDVLEAAGGASKEAVLNKINLAACVYDGVKIYIPDKEDSSTEGQLPDTGKNSANMKMNENQVVHNDNDKININNASISQLEELPGIGPSKAEKIIDYRRNIGKFENYQQLLSVKGIGEKTLNKIKKELRLR